MALSREKKFGQRIFYKWLCREYPESVVIREWEGRSEDKLEGKGNHFSRFDGGMKLDVVRAYRIPDRNISPIMIGYEIKGTESEKKGGNIIYRPPAIHEGEGQASWILDLDANYVCVVRPPPAKSSDVESIIQHYKRLLYFGLYFINEINGVLEFQEVVKATDKEPYLNVNLDRKKMNLANVVMHKGGYQDIQKQNWARNTEWSII